MLSRFTLGRAVEFKIRLQYLCTLYLEQETLNEYLGRKGIWIYDA